MKTVIVGGVAGGMSAATRLRRLRPDDPIVVFERGEHVSYANCGLPYHVGGVIADREDLLLQTPPRLRERFGLDVRVRSEVLSVDRAARTVRVREQDTGREYNEAWDRLVLSPGAAPFVPDLPGIERALPMRTVADAVRITAAIDRLAPRTAVVVGGGFIGLEAAENLHRRGLGVTVVELDTQVLAPLDPELAALVHTELRAQGVTLALGTGLDKVLPDAVELADGRLLDADLVLLSIGVRPEAGLAREAGLVTGPRGGIAVDEAMRTSDPDIYAVGDAVEKTDHITGGPALIPLANTANRQGRLVADAIAGRPVALGGRLGTAIVRVFGLTVAVTGWNEKRLRAAGRTYQAVHTHPSSHAGYYPGAVPMALKLLYHPGDGTILGAQAVGGDGVDKRIDVLATAMRGGLTATELADLELAYAPQFGSAKDPVNMLGYIADNLLSGMVRSVQWHELDAFVAATGATLLDVRTPEEYAAGHIPGALSVPLDGLYARRDQLPAGPLVVYCQAGQRAHTAASLIGVADLPEDSGRLTGPAENQPALAADRVANLDGGYLTWLAAQPAT